MRAFAKRVDGVYLVHLGSGVTVGIDVTHKLWSPVSIGAQLPEGFVEDVALRDNDEHLQHFRAILNGPSCRFYELGQYISLSARAMVAIALLKSFDTDENIDLGNPEHGEGGRFAAKGGGGPVGRAKNREGAREIERVRKAGHAALKRIADKKGKTKAQAKADAKAWDHFLKSLNADEAAFVDALADDTVLDDVLELRKDSVLDVIETTLGSPFNPKHVRQVGGYTSHVTRGKGDKVGPALLDCGLEQLEGRSKNEVIYATPDASHVVSVKQQKQGHLVEAIVKD